MQASSLMLAASALLATVLLALASGVVAVVPPPYQPNAINVHIVPHTHDDVGWLKTVDEYYYGANQTIQYAAVQYILDSVMVALAQNSSRRFIYVEQGFFQRWWREQTAAMQETVRGFVASGQLEFINGGWTMNDEAAPHYAEIVDQMTYGHQFILEQFNVTPSIGWHIDPFGHSASHPVLMAKMGFNGFFFARIHYQDYELRARQSRMELVWNPSQSDPTLDMYTGVLWNGYGPPSGFCFDIYCSDPPIQADPRLEGYNVEQRAEVFVNLVQQQAASYPTNNVMLTMGSDFQYQNAMEWFKNLDLLIGHLQANQTAYGLNIFYSTPSIYTAYVHQAAAQSGLFWTTKQDDFFPYADNQNSYWTGYFTSRPSVKGFVRQHGNVLHAAQQLATLSQAATAAVPSPALLQTVDALQEPVSLTTHHDAVAGTEQQHVADDYVRRVAAGRVTAFAGMASVIDALQGVANSAGAGAVFVDCPLLNQSVCTAAAAALGAGGAAAPKTLVVTAWNTLAWNRTAALRIPSPTAAVYVVDGATGATVPSQVQSSLSNGYSYAGEDFEGEGHAALPHVVVFQVQLPPLGYGTYYVVPGGDGSNAATATTYHPDHSGYDGGVVLQNDQLVVEFKGGRMSSLTNKATGTSATVLHDLFYYAGYAALFQQDSGAYIFRPAAQLPNSWLVPHGNASQKQPPLPTVTSYVGAVSQELHQVWIPGELEAVVRLYNGSRYVELELLVGPIFIGDGVGKEVVSRFNLSLDSALQFATDANGLEMQQRLVNYQPSFPLNQTQPVAGNYYPVNSAIYIEDQRKGTRFSVLTDRSCGGTSLGAGHLELMVHRRLLVDDGRGVGEPLNETEQIRATHWLSLEPITQASRYQRIGHELLYAPPMLLFATAASPAAWAAQRSPLQWSAVQQPLPDNVRLLTLATLPATNQTLLRLVNIFAVGEDATLSANATVDLDTLFAAPLAPQNVREMTLTATRPVATLADRLHWRTSASPAPAPGSTPYRATLDPQSNEVTLAPMDIATLLLTL